MQLHNEKRNACGVELDFSPLGNKYIDTCHKGLLSKVKSRFSNQCYQKVTASKAARHPWSWVKDCSHGTIATARYFSHLMGCMGFNVIVAMEWSFKTVTPIYWSDNWACYEPQVPARLPGNRTANADGPTGCFHVGECNYTMWALTLNLIQLTCCHKKFAVATSPCGHPYCENDANICTGNCRGALYSCLTWLCIQILRLH